MGMTAGEIVILVFLLIIVALVIWYFAIAFMYGQKLNNFSYTRGANLDTKDKNKGTVNMSCEQGAEICVWKATAICSGPNSSSNTELGPEPISNGLNGNSAYGQFDVNNTIDLTKDMATKADGKQNYSYNFDVTNRNFGGSGGKACPMNYDPKTGAGQRPQLIATYSCIPPGTKCVSSIPPTPGPPPPPPPDNNFSRIGSVTNITTLSINNNNQICSTDNKGIIQCLDNFKSPSSQWKKLDGGLSQISLSDSGSLSGIGSTDGIAYYGTNFNNPVWSGIPGTGKGENIRPSWTSNRLFGPGVKNVIGNMLGQSNMIWVSNPDNSTPTYYKNSIYGFMNFDSNSNGDICGITGNKVNCVDKNGTGSGIITSPFTPVYVSLNSKGLLCATTSTGDISCATMSSWTQNNPTWTTVSKGQNFSAISVNDNGTICAAKNTDGSVWCSK